MLQIEQVTYRPIAVEIPEENEIIEKECRRLFWEMDGWMELNTDHEHRLNLEINIKNRTALMSMPYKRHLPFEISQVTVRQGH